jgi:hypothetical protein
MSVFRANPSRRKFRLFACACCRRVWGASRIAPEPHLIEAVDLAERFADGLSPDESRRQLVRTLTDEAAGHAGSGGTMMALATLKVGTLSVGRSAVAACSNRVAQQAEAAWVRGVDSPGRRAAGQAAAQVEYQAQADLFRDIIGNPFRPVTLDPAWRTGTAASLAEGMYESRDFSPMPILADALQDAGCDNEDMLGHCRGDGPHVRGCWVVDLLLGKG